MKGGIMKKMRVVIYCRVATKNQLDDDLALKNQSALLHQQAERENLTIVGEVQAYEKGTYLDRPGWQKAIHLAAEKDVASILVTKLDRVARDFLLLEQAVADLDKRGLKLSSGDSEVFPLLRSSEYIS